MGKFLAVILILVICAIIAVLPVWAVINFMCWAFHLSFHLTLLQAFAICLVASVIKNLFFKKGDK